MITERDERNFRSEVNDIIIKEGNSTQRLINEIKIFVHNVKENKIDSINNTLDSEKFSGKVVLVVDDDMRNIFALSSILQRIGIEVEMANNGKEAIEMLESMDKVDLVLMDIMMPLMDGYEAMKLIRKMDEYKDLPIIALTAKAMKGDKEICIKAGANEYLSKPIDKNKLLSILRVWI
jgi:tubulin-specific chaperone A